MKLPLQTSRVLRAETLHVRAITAGRQTAGVTPQVVRPSVDFLCILEKAAGCLPVCLTGDIPGCIACAGPGIVSCF